MKTIKIFLGSSLDELNNERRLLGDYIMNSVRPIFKKDDVDIEVYKNEDIHSTYSRNPEQRDIDKLLRKCDVSVFMFKSKAGDMTIHEFDVARTLQKSKQHEIYVYCFSVPEADKSQKLKDFQNQIIKDSFYWYDCKDITDMESQFILGLLKLERRLLGMQAPIVVNQKNTTEKDGDTLFEDFERHEQNQVSMKEKIHQDIDKLLQQTKAVMANKDETISAKIFKVIELYKKADQWAAATDYDKKKYSDFLFDFAQFLDKYGLYQDAETVYLRQTVFAEELYGKEHEKTATSYNNIGLVYYHKGDYDKALEYYFKALAISEKLLGTENPDTATSFNNIGSVYDDLGDYDKALECLVKALKIREKVLGLKHPDTASSYNNIGEVYKDQGNYDKALEHYFKALKIREKALGTEHPDTASSYNNIGMVYCSQGDYDKALGHYFKALKIREKVLGTVHPDTASSYNNIGSVYYEQGDYDKALEYYVKSLTTWEKVLGKEHPDTATSYNNIGMVYYSKGDYVKALEYHQKALMIYEKVFGTEHPTTTTSYINIGLIYKALDDYDKASEYLFKGLKTKEKTFGTTASSYNNLGTVYYEQGNYDKALEFYLKALKIREEVLGTEHPDTASSYNNIGEVYKNQGNHGKALKFYIKALKIREKVLGTEHPDTASSYNNIGEVYKDQGNYDKALEYYFKALAIREKILGTEHPDTASSYNNIGLVYNEQGSYTKALEYFHKAFAITNNNQIQFDFETHTFNLLIKHINNYLIDNNARYVKEYYHSPNGSKYSSGIRFDLAVLDSEDKLLRVYEICTFSSFECNSNFIQKKLLQINELTDAEVFLAFTVLKNELIVLPLSEIIAINEKRRLERTEKTKAIKSFTEYYLSIKEICGNRVQDQQYFFRGQPDMQYDPMPSIYRKGRIEKERDLFLEAIRRNPNEFTEDMSTFDKLVKMQHYELPTRLLDITKNPLVALFFACQKDFEADGEVLVYSVFRDGQIQYFDSDDVCILANLAKCPNNFDIKKDKNHLVYSIKKDRPIFDEQYVTSATIQDVLCVLPKLNNSRISKQDGAFFIFGMGKDKKTPAEFLDAPTTIIVKADAKKEILNELELLGINEASLFPETDKVMHQIREEFCEN